MYVNPKLLTYPSPLRFPFGHHKLVFHAGQSASVLKINPFVSFLKIRFHVWVVYVWYTIWYLSSSDLIRLAWCSLRPPVLLQRAPFRPCRGWAALRCACVHRSASVHASHDRHSGWLQVLASADSASVNIRVCVTFLNSFFPDICPRGWLQDHLVVLFSVFKEPPYCSPSWLNHFAFPPEG